MSAADRLVVAGGGLGGSLVAILLARAGREVLLLERRPDPRAAGAERGRSINLAISARGFQALERVGLKETVLARSLQMRGRRVHPVAGPTAFQPYGTEGGQGIHSVSRAGLNEALLDAAEAEPGVTVRFDARVVRCDLDAPAVELAGGERIGGRAVIGADGAFSAVRASMQRRERFDYSQDYLGHGYKELSIPPAPDGSFALDPHALHIWPRGGHMMIALPNVDRSFTATLFWPWEGPLSFAAVRTADDVARAFREVFPDAVPLMPDLVEDYLGNPVGSLVTVRCRPWHHGGRVVLLGDAAHAVVPFYGQGANCSFEDCVVLDECLRESPGDLERAFTEYFRRRKEHADALADLAIGNFHEMRDKVASPLFRGRKRAEKLLHRIAPNWYIPLYSMVSFSTIPYADAVRRARRQDRAVAGAAGVLLAAGAAVLGWWLWT